MPTASEQLGQDGVDYAMGAISSNEQQMIALEDISRVKQYYESSDSQRVFGPQQAAW